MYELVIILLIGIDQLIKNWALNVLRYKGVAVSLDKTVFTVRGSHDGGDLTRHRGLFCDNYLHDDSDFSVVVFL